MHFARVDIEQALEQTSHAVSLYRTARLHTNAPAFSGGVLDAWPNWAVIAFAVLRQEEAAVVAWLKAERAKEQPNG